MAILRPEAGEQLIRVSREHWIKYVMPVFVYVLLLSISLLLFVLAGVSAHHYMWLSHATFLCALALFLITHHWFFLFLLSESLVRIIITNHRVVRLHQRLYLEDEMLEISFEKMKSVEARKNGLLQNMLHYGSLWFESGARVSLVPHPNALARDIEQAMGLE